METYDCSMTNQVALVKWQQPVRTILNLASKGTLPETEEPLQAGSQEQFFFHSFLTH